MPFVPVPNTALVELRFLQDGQQVENTLYFRSIGEQTEVSLGLLANAVIEWWSTNMQDLTSNTVQLRECVATSLEDASAAQVTVVPAIELLGGVATAALPNHVSLAISFRTGFRGRSFRGRNYFVGLTESNVVGNTVSDVLVEALRLAYQGLQAAAEDISQTWVVVSRFSGVDPTTHLPIPRTTGIATPVTTVLIVDDTVDGMRRRLPGRGR